MMLEKSDHHQRIIIIIITTIISKLLAIDATFTVLLWENKQKRHNTYYLRKNGTDNSSR